MCKLEVMLGKKKIGREKVMHGLAVKRPCNDFIEHKLDVNTCRDKMVKQTNIIYLSY